MKIVVIGRGLIGGAVAESLRRDHEVIHASRSDTQYPVDLASPQSVEAFFEKVGEFDALACAAGESWIGPFEELTMERLQIGLRSKLGGQVSLVLEGRKRIRPRGSFTLITGFLTDQPILGGATLALANGGIEKFVAAAAAEIRPLRINAVSPGLIEETATQMGAACPPGLKPVPLTDVVLAYRLSILGIDSGRVIRTHG